VKRLNEKQWRDEKELRDAVLLKSVNTEVSAAEEERVLNFKISTESVDSYNDVIKADGWDLERYKKNPVVLWAHSHWQPPVGKAISVGIEDKDLVATAKFAEAETYAFADTVYRLLKDGFLRATSVGFFPKEWTYDEERGGYTFIAQELFEFSVVPVPANPDALTTALKAGEIDMEPLREWAEKTLEAWGPEESVALWVPKEAVEHVALSLRQEPKVIVDVGEQHIKEVLEAAAATVDNQLTADANAAADVVPVTQSNETSPDVVVTSTTTDATGMYPTTTTAPQTTDTIILNGVSIVDPVAVEADGDADERFDIMSDEIESLKAQVDQLLAKVAADEAAAKEAEEADDLSEIIDLSFEPVDVENEIDRSIVDLDIDPEQLHDVIRRQLESEFMKHTGKLPKEV
jgi:HK97 family phage prohead protease